MEKKFDAIESKKGEEMFQEGEESVDYNLCSTMRMQVEGDMYLLDEVLAQIKYNMICLAKAPFPTSDARTLHVPIGLIPTLDRRNFDLPTLKLEIVESVKRSRESLINAITYNNFPVLRIYLHNSFDKGKDIKKVKDFISSNYDRLMVDQLLKGKAKPEKADNDKAMKTHWLVLAVGRVQKAQQKKISFSSLKPAYENFIGKIVEVSPECLDKYILETVVLEDIGNFDNASDKASYQSNKLKRKGEKFAEALVGKLQEALGDRLGFYCANLQHIAPSDMQKKTILKANIAGFYKHVGKHGFALEVYQNMEKELDEAIKNPSWTPHPEKEKRQLNPLDSTNVETVFGKELAKNKITVIAYKQWLFWNKIKCLIELKVPYLSAMVSEVYLSFLQKYQFHSKTPELYQSFMLLQTCNLITSCLKKEIEKNIGIAETQQRFCFSALSRLFFQEKQYLHKAVEHVYSMKPLSMKKQHEKNIELLIMLGETQDEGKFKKRIHDTHARETCQFSKSARILEQLSVPTIQSKINNITSLIEYDRSLKNDFKDYSSRGRAQRNTDYINYFDLRWLMFYETEDVDIGSKFKANENGALSFSKSPWGLLYEYAVVQNLMIHLLRDKDTKEIVSTSLELCQYYLKTKALPSLASIFWTITLLYSGKKEKIEYEVTSLFSIERDELNDQSTIVFHNPFGEFAMDQAFLASDRPYSLSTEPKKIVHGKNYFPFSGYGNFTQYSLNFVVGSTVFCISVPDELLKRITREVRIKPIFPKNPLYTKNLIFLEISPNYKTDESIMEIRVVTSNAAIRSKGAVCNIKKGNNRSAVELKEAEITLLDKTYSLIVPSINGVEETGYLCFELETLRDLKDRGEISISLDVKMKHKEKVDSVIAKHYFDYSTPSHLTLSYNTLIYGESKEGLQTIIKTTLPVEICKVNIAFEGVEQTESISIGEDKRVIDSFLEARYLTYLKTQVKKVSGTAMIIYKYLHQPEYEQLPQPALLSFLPMIKSLAQEETVLQEAFYGTNRNQNQIEISYQDIGMKEIHIGEYFSFTALIDIIKLDYEMNIAYAITGKDNWAILGKAKSHIDLKEGPKQEVLIKAIAINHGKINIPHIEIKSLHSANLDFTGKIEERGGCQTVTVSPKQVISCVPKWVQ